MPDASIPIQRYRKRPVEVQAVQLRWDTWSEMCEHAHVGLLREGKPQGCWVDPSTGTPVMDEDDPAEPARTPLTAENVPSVTTDHEIGLLIPTLEGLMLARQGDWVIRGVAGELYPCKPDIFDATYEPVEDPACDVPSGAGGEGDE